MLRWSPAAALVSVALLSGTAAADISRGCKAEVVVHVDPKKTVIAEIEGRGTCKNRFHADDCRHRARDAITTCMQDLWYRRGANALPASCTISTGPRPFAVFRWLTPSRPGVKENKLVDRIRWAACCRLYPGPSAGRLLVHTKVSIRGDDGCRRDLDMNPNGAAEADCYKYRAEGLCQ